MILSLLKYYHSGPFVIKLHPHQVMNWLVLATIDDHFLNPLLQQGWQNGNTESLSFLLN